MCKICTPAHLGDRHRTMLSERSVSVLCRVYVSKECSLSGRSKFERMRELNMRGRCRIQSHEERFKRANMAGMET